MISLVLRNMLRNRRRSLLTLLGVAVAIFVYASLQAAIDGILFPVRQATERRLLHVREKGRTNVLASRLPERLESSLASVPGVAGATGVLTDLAIVGDQRVHIFVYGVDDDAYRAIKGLRVSEAGWERFKGDTQGARRPRARRADGLARGGDGGLARAVDALPHRHDRRQRRDAIPLPRDRSARRNRRHAGRIHQRRALVALARLRLVAQGAGRRRRGARRRAARLPRALARERGRGGRLLPGHAARRGARRGGVLPGGEGRAGRARGARQARDGRRAARARAFHRGR